jgi:signal transduction histidine kinase
MEKNFARLGQSQIKSAYGEFLENCQKHPSFYELFKNPSILVQNYFTRQITRIERNYNLDALIIVDEDSRLLFGSEYGKSLHKPLATEKNFYHYTEKIPLPLKNEQTPEKKLYALFAFSFKFPELISLQKNLLQGGTYLFLFLFILSVFTVKKLSDRAFDQQQIYEEQKRVMEFGQLAAGVAHDIRNPLTIVMMHIQELCEMHEGDTETISILAKSRKVLNRINHTISSLMVFNRENLSFKEKINLNNLIYEIIELNPELKKMVKIELEPVEITGNHDLLYRMLNNLMQNAFEAVTQTETPLIEVNGSKTTNNYYEIKVTDNGKGVKNLETLFQPFLTTKEKGIGLGLLVIKDAVAQHNGKITVHKNSPQGTCFQIHIPVDGNR